MAPLAGKLPRHPSAQLNLELKELVTLGVSNKQSAGITCLLINSWNSLLLDSPLAGSGQKPHRVLARFDFELRHNPIRETINRYSHLADLLMSQDFSHSPTGAFLPDFRNTPIFREYHDWYRNGTPEVLRYILSFLLFGKKLMYEDENLNATALRAWQGVEERIGQVRFGPKLARLRRLATLLLPKPSPDREVPFMGKHGSGAVSGPERGVASKTVSFAFDARLDRVFFKSVIQTRRHVGPMSSSFPGLATWDHSNVNEMSSTSRLMFVPKSVKTSRSICMEPTSFMYFQQFYRWELEESIKQSSVGRYVTIQDQSRNQRLAWLGSVTSTTDTIDLSAASDSLHVDIVRYVFPRHIAYNLLGCRTSKVLLPDGVVQRVNKFAPMGSALCFPTQSLFYALVVLAAYIDTYSESYGMGEFADVVRNRSSLEAFMRLIPSDVSVSDIAPMSVYGDDIICDSNVTEAVTTDLESLGFAVNHGKSFTRENTFRESCGKYYWCGFDVTPLRFNIPSFGLNWDVEAYASSIDFANRSGDYGYLNLHSYMCGLLLHHPVEGMKHRFGNHVNPILFSQDREDSMAIFHPNPRNAHLSRRVLQRYQREELQSITVVPRVKTYFSGRKPGKGVKTHSHFGDERIELYRLNSWWRAAYLRGDAVPDDASGTPQYDSVGLRAARRWTPSS